MSIYQTSALILIILVLAAWLYLYITRDKAPKLRDGYNLFFLGFRDSSYHIHIVRGTTNKVAGFVTHRPLNGDGLEREDTEGEQHTYVMTDVVWDPRDGTKFTATITPIAKE